MRTREWQIAVDGLSTYRVGGTGVVLYAPDGTNFSLSFNLQFLYSNCRESNMHCQFKLFLYKIQKIEKVKGAEKKRTRNTNKNRKSEKM